MQKWEDDVLELYHNINSVCAQKVRIALKEKRQEAKDHIMTLRGNQYEPAYLRGPIRAGVSKAQSERGRADIDLRWRANPGIVADPLLHRRCLS
jgi:hypothetical protein